MILPDLAHLPGVHRGSTALAIPADVAARALAAGERACHEDVAARVP